MTEATLFPMLDPPPPPPAGPTLALALDYHGRAVRMAGTVDNPRWVAADVGRVLELTNVRDSMADFEPDERGVERFYTPGGWQSLTVVTEAGLYRLIFRSDKPAARAFQRWVLGDVLPSIRRHGCYPPPAAADPGRPLGIGEAIGPATTLIPLAAVPSIPWLPRPPGVDTVYEWHRHGRRGVYLETIRSGGKLWTTEAAVFIFLARLAGPNPRPADAPLTLTLTLNVGGDGGGRVLGSLAAAAQRSETSWTPALHDGRDGGDA